MEFQKCDYKFAEVSNTYQNRALFEKNFLLAAVWDIQNQFPRAELRAHFWFSRFQTCTLATLIGFEILLDIKLHFCSNSFLQIKKNAWNDRGEYDMHKLQQLLTKAIPHWLTQK